MREQIVPLYEWARITLKEERQCSKDIINLDKNIYDLLKVPKCRKLWGFLKEIKKFQQTLDEIMPFWSKTALSTITNKEDKQFLLSMMSDRKAVMSGVDSKLTKTEKIMIMIRMLQIKKDTVSEKSD